MLLSTLSFAMHTLVSSFKVLQPVCQVLEYVLPYAYRNLATAAIKDKMKINFNTKHLKRGDALPPFTGKLRVYNMRYCPYAQRTILALNAKKIDYEVVNINLIDKPEWLHKKSAFLKVPALEVEDGVSIYESLITVEYLDDAYPQRPLLPKDPVKKAFDKIIIETCNAVHGLFYRSLKSPETITEDHKLAYTTALDFVQDHLKSRGTKFLDGAEPGYVDYMIWPWFERILLLHDKFPEVTIDAQKYKLLLEYFANMEKDPAVSVYSIPKDILYQFMKQYITPNAIVEYDMLLEA